MAKLQRRLAHFSFVVLFLVAVGLLMWLSRTYHMQFDWTRNARNSLAPASVALVKKLTQPVEITVYASSKHGTAEEVRELIARFQKHKPDIRLEWVNADTDPARVRAAGVQFDGEAVVQYGNNKENITQINEENLANTLARLARSGERWIVFLSGHGERRPDGQANHDYGIWGAQLQKRGLKTRTLTLNENPQIPQNTAVLVIADPQSRLLAGEVKQIDDYLAQGGNVLWLAEPGGLKGLEPIAELLGFEPQPGTVVDPSAQVLTGNDATFLVIGQYGAHPAVQNLNLMTLFPTASGMKLQTQNKSQWRSTVLLDTLPTAWSETGALKGKVTLDAGREARGPLAIGIAATRELEKREQRVVVIGDADFLSNTYLGNGGNLDLGMNLVNWVSSDEAHIDLPNRAAVDASLNLSQGEQITIAFGFLIFLPLFLLGTGIVVWWRRRRR